MLTFYETATAALLQNPAAPNPLYATSQLDAYINTARLQLAGESECIRALGNLTVSAETAQYSLTSITIPANAPAGIAGALNVRSLWVQVAGSATALIWLTPRTWEEFAYFSLNNAAPTFGFPTEWAQFAQGASGTIFLNPAPNAAGICVAEIVAYPINLVDDTTAEAIPFMWTQAVPYYAAYLALLSSQTGVRTADADKMFERYRMFVDRARKAATPSVLPWQSEQMPVPGGINPQPQAARGG